MRRHRAWARSISGGALIVLVALTALAVANPLAVIQPDGWVEDPELASPAVVGMSQFEQPIEARAFHPPGDTTTMLVVARVFVETNLSPEGLLAAGADRALDDAKASGMTLVSRTDRVDHGQAIGDLVFAHPTGAMRHAHMIASSHDPTRVELLSASCLGTAAAFAACEARLSTVAIPIDPEWAEIDDWNIRRILAGIMVVAVGLGMAAFVIRGAFRRRALQRSAHLVDHELVTVTGIVQPVKTPLIAPLSGRECVLHRSRARLFTGERTPRLTDEPSELEITPFVIVTPRGPVLIDATEAQLELVPAALIARSQARELAFLSRHGFGAERHPTAGFDEIVIAPGSTVTVRGMVRIERDQASTAERGYRDDLPANVRLVAPGNKPVTILRAW